MVESPCKACFATRAAPDVWGMVFIGSRNLLPIITGAYWSQQRGQLRMADANSAKQIYWHSCLNPQEPLKDKKVTFTGNFQLPALWCLNIID